MAIVNNDIKSRMGMDKKIMLDLAGTDRETHRDKQRAEIEL